MKWIKWFKWHLWLYRKIHFEITFFEILVFCYVYYIGTLTRNSWIRYNIKHLYPSVLDIGIGHVYPPVVLSWHRTQVLLSNTGTHSLDLHSRPGWFVGMATPRQMTTEGQQKTNKNVPNYSEGCQVFWM